MVVARRAGLMLSGLGVDISFLYLPPQSTS